MPAFDEVREDFRPSDTLILSREGEVLQRLRTDATVRLNNVGDFALPPSRVEAMYAPEMFGEYPNARVKVVQSR